MKEHEKISFELNPKLLANELYIKFSDFDKVMKKNIKCRERKRKIKRV
jgi:hypothetical protein